MSWYKGWTTWDDVRKEVFTPEEIAESDLRVAMIGELTNPRDEAARATEI